MSAAVAKLEDFRVVEKLSKVTPSQGVEVDRVFFRKDDVKLGAILVYHGRTDPGGRYKIVAIQSSFLTQRKRLGHHVRERRGVPAIRQLADQVTLQPLGRNGLRRTVAFSYLSYSGIWWLDV